MPWTPDRTTPGIHAHTGRRQCVSLINGIFGASVFLMPHHAGLFMRTAWARAAQEQRHLGPEVTRHLPSSRRNRPRRAFSWLAMGEPCN